MITNRVADGLLSRQFRPDVGTGPRLGLVSIPALLVALIAVGFVLWGAAGLELNSVEGRLGLAAAEPLGPFGRVLGGYDPSLAPGVVAICRLWAVLEGGVPTAGAIRWPLALAAVGIGIVLSRRVGQVMGPRVSVFAALATLATVGLIDRSALASDTITGLAVLLAVDHLLAHGSGWRSGFLTGFAFWVGGWPAVAAIVLPLIVIGRPGKGLSLKLMLPVVGTIAAWSIWAWTDTRFQVWAATLAFPISLPWAWDMGWWALLIGLPWSPLAALAAVPAVRAAWPDATKQLVFDWLKVAVVGLLAGSVVPGMSGPGSFLIFGGLVIAVSPILDAAWRGALPRKLGWIVLALVTVVGVYAAARAVVTGSNMALAQPYYRGVGLLVIGVGTAIGLAAVDGAWTRSTRSVLRTLLLVMVFVKLIHVGFHQPETSYRFGKGAWGRAIGQHVPPKWPIYVFHSVDPALAFATERPIRQLRAEIFLKAQPGDGPKFVLLAESEFEHWPEDAPKIQKVRAFQDEHGGTRVLARTEGKMVRLDHD